MTRNLPQNAHPPHNSTLFSWGSPLPSDCSYQNGLNRCVFSPKKPASVLNSTYGRSAHRGSLKKAPAEKRTPKYPQTQKRSPKTQKSLTKTQTSLTKMKKSLTKTKKQSPLEILSRASHQQSLVREQIGVNVAHALGLDKFK